MQKAQHMKFDSSIRRNLSCADELHKLSDLCGNLAQSLSSAKTSANASSMFGITPRHAQESALSPDNRFTPS